MKWNEITKKKKKEKWKEGVTEIFFLILFKKRKYEKNMKKLENHNKKQKEKFYEDVEDAKDGVKKVK